MVVSVTGQWKAWKCNLTLALERWLYVFFFKKKLFALLIIKLKEFFQSNFKKNFLLPHSLIYFMGKHKFHEKLIYFEWGLLGIFFVVFS
jgi:hypothetical protein